MIAEHYIEYLRTLMPESRVADTCAALATPLRPSLRANTLRAKPAIVKALLNEIGVGSSEIPWWPNAWWWQNKYPEDEFKIGWTVEHQAGALYVQEASSMLPVAALKHVMPNKPKLVLDMCAAPGSKTTQLADWLGNEGLIVANELSSSRLKSLAASLQRCGVINTALSHQDAQAFGAQAPACFDAILLDAPCTGEGTHRKDPNALKTWSLTSVQQTAELQKRLIESAFQALKPGGVLIYSTCTLNQYENHQVCQHLLEAYPEQIKTISLQDLFPGAEKAVTPDGWLWILPQLFDCEGFFVAAFRKQGELLETTHQQQAIRLEKSVRQQAEDLVQQTFGQAIENLEHRLLLKNDQLWLLPENLQQLPNSLRLNRAGVPIIERKGKVWRLCHESTLVFSVESTMPLSRQQASEYLMGRDLELAAESGDESVVSFNDIVLGLAKPVRNRLKNLYPREFVSDRMI